MADDGAAGERDDVRDSFEYLVGGSAGDTIITSQTRYQPFELTGNGGNDVITGGDNYDDLYGGDGDDTIAGGDGSDSFRYCPCNDLQRGDEGADVFP